jgi:hypothetical protein
MAPLAESVTVMHFAMTIDADVKSLNAPVTGRLGRREACLPLFIDALRLSWPTLSNNPLILIPSFW